MRTEPKTEVFLAKPTDGKIFETVTTLVNLCILMFVTCEDGDFGELFDHVDYDVQSAPPSAADHEDEDRLEQDNRVQNWHGTEFEGRS